MERGAPLLTAALVGAISGLVGGAAAQWLRPRAPEVKPAKADVAAPADDGRDVAARIEALENEVARLRQQRATSASAARAPAASARPAEGGRERALPDDPVFEAAVRDVMERVQQERVNERDERRAEAAQRWADQLGEKLQLTDAQKASVLTIAQDLGQRLRELRDAAGGPPGGPSMREQRNALVAQAEKRLGEVLSSKQMQVYQESSDLQIGSSLRGGWRGRGGGQ